MSTSILSLFENFNCPDIPDELQDNYVIETFSNDNTKRTENDYSHEFEFFNNIDNYSIFNAQNNNKVEIEAQKFIVDKNVGFSTIKNIETFELKDKNNISEEQLYELNYSTENTSNIHKKSKKRKRHTKFASDNIKRKILNHYFKFLTNLINTIINLIFINEENKPKIQFLTIRYDFRNSNFDKKMFNSLRKKTIKDIFLNYPNNKNQNSKKINENVMNYIINKNNNVINNILGQLCFEFINLYHNNGRHFNLSKYGLNETICLQKIDLFQDLLKANIMNDEKENEIYFENMEKCFQEYYLRKPTYFRVK